MIVAHYAGDHSRFVCQLADPWRDLAPNFIPGLLRITVSLDARDRPRLELLRCRYLVNGGDRDRMRAENRTFNASLASRQS